MVALKYNSKYSTVLRCKNCGHENEMPCNFCEKCGKKLFKDRCLHCWRIRKKVVKSTAQNCNTCNIYKYSPKGRFS